MRLARSLLHWRMQILWVPFCALRACATFFITVTVCSNIISFAHAYINFCGCFMTWNNWALLFAFAAGLSSVDYTPPEMDRREAAVHPAERFAFSLSEIKSYCIVQHNNAKETWSMKWRAKKLKICANNLMFEFLPNSNS